MSADPPRGPGLFRRTLRWALLGAIVLTLFTAAFFKTGQWGPIMLALFMPPAFIAYFLALLLPVGLFIDATLRLRETTRRGMAKLQMAGAVLLGGALVFPILAFLLPEIFSSDKPRGPDLRRVTEADFTAPWGGRMIALDIAALPSVNRRAQRLWVAETALTRGEAARLLATEAGADAALPLTALSRERLDALLAAMNAAPHPAQEPAAARFRVPEFHEALAYMDTRRAGTYRARCEPQLAEAAQLPADEFALRGNLDNAAEIVHMAQNTRDWAGPPFCALEGGVEPYCGVRARTLRAWRVVACEDRGTDALWNHPAVGLRVVYGEDVYGAR